MSLSYRYGTEAGNDGPAGASTTAYRPVKYLAATPIASLESVATTIVVCEQKANGNNAQMQNQGDLGNTTGSGLTGHLGTSNFLYADGHVKSLKPLATVANNVNHWLRNSQSTAPGSNWLSALGKTQSEMN